MAEKLRILMLEDNADDEAFIKVLLQREGRDYDYLTVADKEDFIAALNDFAPDVILADNSIPQFDATDALRFVKDKGFDVVFILITGTVSEEFAVKIMKAGADDYMLKDRLHRLPAAIDAGIRQHKTERDKQEVIDKLVQNESKYRNLVERISDGFIGLGHDFRIAYVNKMAEELLGRTSQDLIGKKLQDEFPEAVGHPFFEAYLEASRTNNVLHLEDYSIVLDRWMFVSVYPSESGLSIFFRDISEQRKAEIELQQSQLQYRLLVERIKDAFISLDSSYRYTFLNSTAAALLQKDPATLIGKNVWDVFPEAIGSKTYYSIITAFETQEYVYSEDYFAPLDLWHENHIYPSPNGLSIFIRNVSKRKKAELELKRTNELFRTAISATSDTIWKLNFETRRYFVYDGDDHLEREQQDYHQFPELKGWRLHDEDMHRVRQSFVTDSSDKEKTFWTCEYRVVMGEKLKHVINHARFIRDDAGKPLRAIGAISDITDRKNLENELLQQQKNEQLLVTATALDAQERERNLIGIELHDNVNQILVGTKLLLSVVQSDSVKFRQIVTESMSNLQSAIEENRRISHVLVSPNLKSDSLENQLISLFHNMLERGGIVIDLDTRTFKEEKLSNAQKLAIYRIAQEQCTNIAKYANASRVSINLEMIDDNFFLRIADDGNGADNNEQTNGIGLRNISARATVLGGNTRIITSPNQGFFLEVFFPLKP